LPFVPEFSAKFSAPPEFSGGVTEKYFTTGWVRTFDLQIMNQIFYRCATASLCIVAMAFIVFLAGIVQPFL
jgi:hypothetical protein